MKLNYGIEESDQFLVDVEESAVWILLNNVQQSESFAENKVQEPNLELVALKDRLQRFPESGEGDSIQGVRQSPIYGGRYSARWTVNHVRKTVILISLTDLKYPKNLRYFQFDN